MVTFPLKEIKSLKRAPVGLCLTAVCALCLGCEDYFDDESMAELKKTEILSIVLSPPEIAPGETSRATVLLSDEHGVIDNAAYIWLPDFDLDDPGGRRRTGAGSADLDAIDDIEVLTEPAFDLTLDDDRSYDTDPDGFAEHTIGLLAFTDDFEVMGLRQHYEAPDLDALLGESDIKLGFRTILVSNRENKNQNPRIRSVRCRVEDSDRAEGATLVRSYDALTEIESLRQRAADYPIEAEEKVDVTFSVTVEDDDPIEEAIRYQWISTGGDFGGRREQKQTWTAPEYREPEGSERDQSGQRDVDRRIDPNLYPVWIILRDNGIANRMGQSWAEFYVRVVPKGNS